MIPAVMRRPANATLAVLATLVLASVLGACGTQANDVLTSNASAQVKTGSQLFVAHCAGCHTLSEVGAEGGATKIRDQERVDGPNFDQRKECVKNVLYAIRNGGYSGAIMPENIVTGGDAQAVAAFLQQYSGSMRKKTAGAKLLTCPAEK